MQYDLIKLVFTQFLMLRNINLNQFEKLLRILFRVAPASRSVGWWDLIWSNESKLLLLFQQSSKLESIGIAWKKKTPQRMTLNWIRRQLNYSIKTKVINESKKQRSALFGDIIINSSDKLIERERGTFDHNSAVTSVDSWIILEEMSKIATFGYIQSPTGRLSRLSRHAHDPIISALNHPLPHQIHFELFHFSA